MILTWVLAFLIAMGVMLRAVVIYVSNLYILIAVGVVLIPLAVSIAGACFTAAELLLESGWCYGVHNKRRITESQQKEEE